MLSEDCGRSRRSPCSPTAYAAHSDPPSRSLLPGITVLALAAGGSHTCAVMNGGELKCWGYNNYGGLGIGSRNQLDRVGLGTGVCVGADLRCVCG